MAQFKMKIAGQVAQVDAMFESTPAYCRPYLTEEKADFSLAVTRDMLVFEQDQLDEEARQEGFRLRTFTDPFLERAAIQRAFAEHLLAHNTLLLHGSAIAVDETGYLFTARSGTGKSTHTRLWREVFGQRAQMINDDKPFLQLTDQSVLVCGCPWSGKHGLDSNITVPLSGICILERGTQDRIFPLAPDQAMPMLSKQAYWPLAEEDHPLLRRLLDTLANQVPLWRMECTKDPQAARVAWSAMSKGF